MKEINTRVCILLHSALGDIRVVLDKTNITSLLAFLYDDDSARHKIPMNFESDVNMLGSILL